MKKKLIALLSVTALVFSMTACGSDEKKAEGTEKETKKETKETDTIRLAAGDPMKEELINAIKHSYRE